MTPLRPCRTTPAGSPRRAGRWRRSPARAAAIGGSSHHAWQTRMPPKSTATGSERNHATASRWPGSPSRSARGTRRCCAAFFAECGRSHRAVLATGRVADRVQLVVAHDHHGTARGLHPAHDPQHLDLARPPVDQVADEHGDPPFRVPPGAVPDPVTQYCQKQLQLAVLPVHIADHVVAHRFVSSPVSGITQLTILDFAATCN